MVEIKISEVDLDMVKGYLHLDSNEEDLLLQLIMDGAKDYIKSYTGISADEDLDTKSDLTISYLALINEMFDNRSFTTESDKVNKLIDNMLNMYCLNLL